MKKGWKIFWSVCGVSMVVGIICCVVSLSLGVTVEAIVKHFPNGCIGLGSEYVGFRCHDRENTEYRGTNSVENYPGVREIDVEMGAGNVIVELYDGESVSVETQNVTEHLKFRSYMEGDTLNLRTRKRVVGVNGGGEIGTIYLRIPREMKPDDVSMQIKVGELRAEDINAKELSVEMGVGNAVVHNFHADKASLKCGTGSLEVTGNAGTELDLENDIGDIICHVTGNQKEYNYNISCDVGEVRIGEEVYSGIKERENVHNNAGKLMNIECGIGDVTVDFTGA